MAAPVSARATRHPPTSEQKSAEVSSSSLREKRRHFPCLNGASDGGTPHAHHRANHGTARLLTNGRRKLSGPAWRAPSPLPILPVPRLPLRHPVDARLQAPLPRVGPLGLGDPLDVLAPVARAERVVR